MCEAKEGSTGPEHFPSCCRHTKKLRLMSTKKCEPSSNLPFVFQKNVNFTGIVAEGPMDTSHIADETLGATVFITQRTPKP